MMNSKGVVGGKSAYSFWLLGDPGVGYLIPLHWAPKNGPVPAFFVKQVTLLGPHWVKNELGKKKLL